MSLTDHLTMQIEIWRRSAGALNEYGEQSDTWLSLTTISGLIQPTGGNVSRVDPGISNTGTHTLFCLIGSNILQGDKAKYNNLFYNVISVNDAAGKQHHFEVALEVIE